jgi:hypothetical protein
MELIYKKEESVKGFLTGIFKELSYDFLINFITEVRKKDDQTFILIFMCLITTVILFYLFAVICLKIFYRIREEFSNHIINIRSSKIKILDRSYVDLAKQTSILLNYIMGLIDNHNDGTEFEIIFLGWCVSYWISSNKYTENIAERAKPMLNLDSFKNYIDYFHYGNSLNYLLGNNISDILDVFDNRADGENFRKGFRTTYRRKTFITAPYEQMKICSKVFINHLVIFYAQITVIEPIEYDIYQDLDNLQDKIPEDVIKEADRILRITN